MSKVLNSNDIKNGHSVSKPWSARNTSRCASPSMTRSTSLIVGVRTYLTQRGTNMLATKNLSWRILKNSSVQPKLSLKCISPFFSRISLFSVCARSKSIVNIDKYKNSCRNSKLALIRPGNRRSAGSCARRMPLTTLRTTKKVLGRTARPNESRKSRWKIA